MKKIGKPSKYSVAKIKKFVCEHHPDYRHEPRSIDPGQKKCAALRRKRVWKYGFFWGFVLLFYFL